VPSRRASAQIKQYLLLLQSRHTMDEGWEGWLPRHGYTGLLGSRWVAIR